MPICSRSKGSGAWSGGHYQRTALDWLKNFDAHRTEIERVLRRVHGEDTALRMRRWRWFFLATAGLFGYADGSERGVSHCRMKACLNKSQSLRSCFFPSPIVGEGGFAKRRRVRGLSGGCKPLIRRGLRPRHLLPQGRREGEESSLPQRLENLHQFGVN